MKRSCGGCTQCCKFLGVPEIPKPGFVWCKHCDIGSGCRIYETRPGSCRDFSCMWLLDPQNIFSDQLRPDKCGVVLFALVNGATVAVTDPARPTAWRHPELLPKLRNLADAGYPVSVDAKNRHWIITGTTDWEVPPEYKERMPNGMMLLRCPDEVAASINLKVRPECKSLGPVLNPFLEKDFTNLYPTPSKV